MRSQNITAEFLKKSQELLETPFRTVYHYTSTYSLQKILDSKTLISTYYKDLNDKAEFEHARDSFLKIRSGTQNNEFKHITNLQLDYNIKKYNTTIDKELLKQNSLIQEEKVNNLFEETFNSTQEIYVSSFCEHENYYPAWRFYGDEGKGVAIGFKEKFFSKNINVLNSFPLGVIFAKVIYNEAEYSKKFKELIELVTAQIRRVSEFNIDSVSEIIGLYGAILLGYCSTIKHPAYESEKEYRVVIHTNKKMLTNQEKAKYYIDDFFIQRAKLITLEPDDIEVIYFGPCMPKDKQKQIRTWLNENGYEKVETKESDIPYRGK
jgi:hypothetical protein